MKVAITCDSLLERDHSTSLLETVLASYPEAEVYTLAHVPGQVLGPVEHHRIHSSFLSNLVKSKQDLAKYSFLVPAAAQKLFIPCSVDLVIDVSSGLSHGIRRCDKSKSVTYIYGFNMPQGHWAARPFRDSLVRWSWKRLQARMHVFASSQGLGKELGLAGVQIIAPAFELGEFPLVSEHREFVPGKRDFWTVNTVGIEDRQALNLVRILGNLGEKVMFAGQDTHLVRARRELGGEFFFGERCDGELGPFLASGRGAIDLSRGPFPLFALKALALGRPVVVADNAVNRSLLRPLGVAFANVEDAPQAVRGILGLSVPADKLRAQAMRFPPLKFKSEILRAIQHLN